MDNQNKIINREAGGVLFEENEPLFPPVSYKRNRGRAVAVAIVVLLVIAAAFICSGASASMMDFFKNNGFLPLGDGTESENGEQTTESTTDSESISENSQQSETAEPDDSDGQTETELNEDETSVQIAQSVVSADMSQADKGDRYIVNYTGMDIDVGGLLDRGFTDGEERGDPAPVIMIIHTHTSEEYFCGEDVGHKGPCGVVSVGDKMSSVLNSMGLSTVHCTVIHDADEGVNAYQSARDTIKTMLEIYPTIKYVIDVHRMYLVDADGSFIRTLSKKDEATAQIRFTVSADKSSDQLWQENLSLALTLKQKLNLDNSHICMPTVVSSSAYNSDLAEYYLMVDVGSVGNSTREAILAGEILARAIADTLISQN